LSDVKVKIIQISQIQTQSMHRIVINLWNKIPFIYSIYVQQKLNI